MNTLSVDAVRLCFEGAIPAMIATCAPDGTPNVSYASQVHYVDREHVALSFQFFNKTHRNVVANPRATVLVTNPVTVVQYCLHLAYLRTEESGPVFESLRARLAGVASHTGMAGVFKLRGADIYRVLRIERVPGPELPAPPASGNVLAAVRAVAQVVASQCDLAALCDGVLGGLAEHFGFEHSMILVADARRHRLFTIASRGYPESGVGSEIAYGQGVIGVAAEQHTPIRINFMTSDVSYARAIRASAEASGLGVPFEPEIPMPGLPRSASQLAVPIIVGGVVAGVLYVESPQEMRFTYDDEDALVAIAVQVGMSIAVLQQQAEAPPDDAKADAEVPAPMGAPVVVRLYRANDSVFVGDDYLIKGVAGSIFWKLVRDFTERGRTEFTNRELRVDPAVRLPDITDNLEARLILLQRRLAERCSFVRIDKSGRGRFRLAVTRPLKLVEVR
jgi:adenylate cyclase